jgi:hypothetical protein
MSISNEPRSVAYCRGCGEALPVPAHARSVLCPHCKILTDVPARPSPPATAAAAEEPLIVADEGLRPASHRISAGRPRSSEAGVLWAVLGLIALSMAGYAIHLATRPEPAAAPPSPAAVAQPAAPLPPPRPAARPRPAAKVAATPATAAPPKPEVVEVIQEPEDKGKAMAGADADPAKKFETGSNFDTPTRPDRYGRPGRSTFENPPHGYVSGFYNPTHGPVSARAPQPSQPSTLDPSFQDPPRARTKPRRRP